MLKEKLITVLRIIFGKKPQIIKKPVIISQLGFTNLLSGKTALITGGSSGIGYEIAKAMLTADASVVITGRNKEKLKAVCHELERYVRNDNCINFNVLDISNVESISSSFQNIQSLLNNRQIDILVNNAGTNGNGSGDFGETTSEDFNLIIDTNLRGTYFLSQIVAKYMVRKNIEGNILNIASSSSLRPANSPYILSKWGLRALTLGMAKTLIKYGITVNGIAPGPTATPMLNRTSDDINFPQNPSKRLSTPEEIANMSVILTSSLGKNIVGDIIYMTGGAGVVTFDDAIYNFNI